MKEILEKYCKLNNRGFYEHRNICCWITDHSLENVLNDTIFIEVRCGGEFLNKFKTPEKLEMFFKSLTD